MNEKIMEKLKDRSFSKKLLELETTDQVKKTFENENIKITDEEIEELRKSINLIVKEIKSLPENGFYISGGTNQNSNENNNKEKEIDLDKTNPGYSRLNNVYQKSLFPETKTWWL